LIVYCRFPLLQSREFSKLLESLVFTTAKACRSIELVKRKSRIYKKNAFTFITYCRLDEDESVEDLFKNLVDIFDKIELDDGTTIEPIYKMIGITNHPYLTYTKRVKSLIDFVCDQFQDRNIREVIDVDTEIMKKFVAHNFVEQTLEDIYEKDDLNDERVVCLAQPIYNEQKASFTTAEVLMRIKVDEQIIYPDEFIPIAEKTGLIHSIGEFVFRDVCEMISREKLWEKGISYIEVNLSVIQCVQVDLVSHFEEVIRKYNIPTSLLCLEITETAEERTPEIIKTNIGRFRDLGIKFALDDYGTGYSNLYKVITLPFSVVKFDKHMVWTALANEKAKLALESEINAMKKMNMKVVAEGVENREQLMELRRMNSDFIQGYYFSKALPGNEFIKFIKEAGEDVLQYVDKQ